MEELEHGDYQEIFLQMELRKGDFKTDSDGNFFFDVEASNENLDLEGQSVLQRALLNSKDYFLTNGVVSKDHLHKKIENGRWVNDEEYVIGEPISVYTDGKSTRVKGKLYRNNKHAQKFIELLESGSSRVKASVAGILPKIVKSAKDQTERVVSVLWNDLALTIAPVNHTVQPASGILAKSLTSYDFVKAMMAGHGTDSSQFAGGRALQQEDIEKNVINTGNYEHAIASLISAISDGNISTMEEAQEFLSEFGINSLISLDVIRELIKNHKEFGEVLPMTEKGSLFNSLIDNIKKSMGGGGIPPKGKKPAEQQETEPEEEEDEKEDEELIDAGEIIKALTDKVEALEKGQEAIVKSINELLEQSRADAEFRKSIGEGLIALMESTEKIAETPIPRKGASSIDEAGIRKGNLGGGNVRKHRQLTLADKDEFAEIITKAVDSKELDMIDSGKLETQINKSIRDPNFQIEPRFLAFLEKKMPKTA